MIFADDCSTDNSIEIMKDIEKKFKNNNIEFKLINNSKRLHCGSSYRNLVEYATGRFFGVLDADDMIEGDAIKSIMKLYIKNPDIAWIYTQFLWCDENMKERRTGFNKAPSKGESLLSMGKRGIHGIGTGFRTFNHKIERKDKLFGKNLTCAVDKYMGYRLEESGKGLFIDKIYYRHRGHPIGSKNSVSSTKYAMEMWKKVIKKAHNRRTFYNKIIYSIIEKR